MCTQLCQATGARALSILGEGEKVFRIIDLRADLKNEK